MPNPLQYAKSPYLKQHEHNPVHWYEWGDEALQIAKNENKIILVSIGYSACHWCHVMAHKCFEDEETAALMNDLFINIKIDREERPDLDAIYMDACQLVTGSGGWPLNAFALPDGTPFHAGTYFPKPQWQNVLKQIAKLWKEQPEKVLKYAADLKKGIQQVSEFKHITSQKSDNLVIESTSKIAANFDKTFGRLNRAPKFPMPTLWNYLLQSGDKELEQQAIFTLEQMSLGGIYDWVEGGFARYSVDERWFAPHFEKMLYDNAQLISLYSKAFAKTGNMHFLRIAEETANFVIKEWRAKDGGYYSALDADSEGIEGKYYCLTSKEIQQLSIKDKTSFKAFFQLTERGNWEHGLNILYPINDEQTFKKQKEIPHFEATLDEWKSILLKHRSSRVKPGLDNKQNTTWNSLLLSGFSHLFQVSNHTKWGQAADSVYQYLNNIPYDNNKSLQHMVHHKTPYINAFLEDYAHTIAGYIHYFETQSNANAIEQANRMTAICIERFYESASGFFKMSDQLLIIDTKIEVTDNVIPSSNSVMCENLLKLGLIFENLAFFKIGEAMLKHMKPKALAHPEHYANWCRLLSIQEKGYPYLLSNKKTENTVLNNLWLSIIFTEEINNLPMLKDKNFSIASTFYYCANNVCHAPVYNTKDIEFNLK